MAELKENLLAALACIANYIEKKKPENLAEAEHMLALISIIASETIGDAKAEAA